MREEDGYIPFMTRFLAWWEGVEPEALVRRSEQDESEDPARQGQVVLDADQAAAAEGKQYGPTRLAMVQRLWGEECHMPGGAIRSLELVKPMALNASKSACDLSAGLGGGTRMIHGELKVWIDAFEPDPELAEMGQDYSTRHGMARKVPIRTYDAAALDFAGKKFDGFLMREVLFRFPAIRAALDHIHAALKPGGHIVLTDFALATDAKRDDPAAKRWLEKDPQAGTPFSLKQYKQAMENLGFDVRIFEDETEQYRKMVLAGWSGFIAGIDKSELTRGFVDSMLLEAEIWLSRMNAFDSGALKLLRIHAIKP